MAGICEGECMGLSPGDEPLTLTRCHIYGLPQLYEALGWKFRLWPTHNLKGIKGKIYFFLKLCFSFTEPYFMA